MEGRTEEPETINVWELMSGLDDDEPSPGSMHFPAILVNKHMPLPPTLAARFSANSFTLEEPSDLRPRAQWKPSRQADRARGESKACVREELTAGTALRQGAQVKSSSLDAPSSKNSSLFGTVSGSNTSSLETLADDLQRSLSFRLAFDKENEGSLSFEDSFYSQCGKAFSGALSTNVAKNFASICPSSDTESRRSLSSFASAKLKKWFKATKRTLKKHTARKAGSKTCGLDTAQPKKSSSESESSSKKLSSESELTYTAPSSPFIGSRRKGSSDLSELDGDLNHGPSELDQKRIGHIGHVAPICQYRHSFTPANKQHSSKESTEPPLNRHSSWEPEKGATDSGVKPVLYSTNSPVDINAYEDCNAVRAILISIMGSSFDEKNVSQHPHHEQELKKGLNLSVVIVPTVFVRGKYIAGIDSIMQMFKKGTLGSILLGTPPRGLKPNSACLCRGGKFLICPLCNGTRKLVRQGVETVSCRHCSGTGLLKCPNCPRA